MTVCITHKSALNSHKKKPITHPILLFCQNMVIDLSSHHFHFASGIAIAKRTGYHFSMNRFYSDHEAIVMRETGQPLGGGAFCAISVSPRREAKLTHLGWMAVRREADFACEALSPEVEIRGWFLPPGEQPITGIRAVCGDEVWVARRKQWRPDVRVEHPCRSDASYSGFTVNCRLRQGWNVFELKFKDTERKWHTFYRCHIRLPLFWPLYKLLAKPAEWGEGGEYGQWTRRHGDPDKKELALMGVFMGRLPRRPLISVLMPVYNTPERWLVRAIESVRNQIYPDWELCIADDRSSNPGVRTLLTAYARKDPRIKLCFREENGHICESSNSALALCTGEFTALLDHDDELLPHALFHVAWEAIKDPTANIVFSDEDKMNEDNRRADPYFKPGWNYDLLLGQNCVSHLGAFRTSLMREVGGFRRGLEGSQDWDLTLRILAKAGLSGVHHIPRVLYSWRTLKTSTASGMEAKPYAALAGRRAVQDHLTELYPGASLRGYGEGEGWRVLWPLPDPPPRVSVIIPAGDTVHMLREAVESLVSVTDYPDLEIIVVNHAPPQQEMGTYLQQAAAANSNLKWVSMTGSFNLSALNNFGVRHSSGGILLFISNEARITESGWLRELVSHALRPDVGAVGACLLYPDGTIQHAGMVLNLTGMAGHFFHRSPTDAPSIGGPPFLVREVTAVSGRCLMIRREIFESTAGFDERQFPLNYGDIDFCLHLRSLGLRNIYTPFARLVQQESDTTGAAEHACEDGVAAMMRETLALINQWPKEVAADAFFNPNFSLSSELPSLSTPRHQWPWLKCGVTSVDPVNNQTAQASQPL